MASDEAKRPSMISDKKPLLSLVVEQDPQSLREKTVAKLREAIIAGYFEPGERLVERDVCAKTDVSRTSLREAFRHLETEGLIISRKGEGVFVRTLTIHDVTDIYELRMALDAEAARLFSERASAERRSELTAVTAQLVEIPYKDYQRTLHFNNEFFRVIYEGAGNELSATIMRSLQSRISLLRAITQRSADEAHYKESMGMMGEIAAEITGGSSRKAAKLCRAFAARSLAFALSVLSQGIATTDEPKSASTVRRRIG
jgi:GntR family transcriptional regulator, trigonelline degradation regulator